MVTNRNKKRAPKYSQKRKGIGTDQGASKGLEMHGALKRSIEMGAKKETSKVKREKRRKTGVIRIGIAKMKFVEKGAPWADAKWRPFSVNFKMHFHMKFWFFCALRALLKVK